MRKNKRLGRPAKKRPYNLSDRQLRIMIFKEYRNPEIQAGCQVMGMALMFDWLKSGKTPETVEQIKSKPPVRLVPKNDPK